MRAPSTEVPVQPQHALSLSDRPTKAFIDLNALTNNFREVRRLAGGRKVLGVVKAQAYGHGAVMISRRLQQLGVEMLGVALVEEGKMLRDAGLETPILVMGAVFPDQAEAIADLRLTPVVFSQPVANALSTAALRVNTRIPVHIKIDSGMGRIGCQPEAALQFIEALKRLPGIEIQGIMTHFADADLVDKNFSSEQMDRFERIIKIVNETGLHAPSVHAANSAAVLDYDRALFTMVRPGIMLYGYSPFGPDAARRTGLLPVLSLTSRIAFLKRLPRGIPVSYGRTFVTKRESLIATVPIGYADGYSRGLSNRGEMLVRGVRVPVVGRVCMDMCMIDVTDVPDVREHDQVVLIGKQGAEQITADDIAAWTGTIAYEVLCGISSRVPRVYV